jgi:hypothetical protein
MQVSDPHKAYWGDECTCRTVYGVRGPDSRNTIVKVPSLDEAADMVLGDDVIVVSRDGGGTWQELGS